MVMLTRQLDNAPAADDLPQCTKSMAMDLIAEGIRSNRCDDLADALNTLGRTQSRWPTVAQVIELLKTCKEPSHQKFLSAPPPDYDCFNDKAARMLADKRRELKRVCGQL